MTAAAAANAGVSAGFAYAPVHGGLVVAGPALPSAPAG